MFHFRNVLPAVINKPLPISASVVYILHGGYVNTHDFSVTTRCVRKRRSSDFTEIIGFPPVAATAFGPGFSRAAT
jgi:hypothetical protein